MSPLQIANGAAPSPIQYIRQLLGPDALLIAVHRGTKRPKRRNWPRITSEKMSDPSYLASLNHDANLGVSLGAASKGLCTIDIDDDAELDRFLNLNPQLRETLTTKRVRGANLWIQLSDATCPATTVLRRADGSKYGEFRSTGAQTVIHGAAVDRRKRENMPTAYRILRASAPIRCRSADIKLPYDQTLTAAPALSPLSEFCNPVSLCSMPLYDTRGAETIVSSIRAAKENDAELQRLFPRLADLYRKWIEPRFRAIANARNNFITDSIPFLYQAVSPEAALGLSMFFYDKHRSLFHDTRADHERETIAMLKTVETNYPLKLNNGEREVYSLLAPFEQNVFRICRDLALHEQPCKQRMTFFMSCKEMADRLGVDPRTIHRVFRRFEFDYKLMNCTQKGKVWTNGERPEASYYRWLLPANAR
jgi:hypothetical protein